MADEVYDGAIGIDLGMPELVDFSSVNQADRTRYHIFMCRQL